MRGGTKRSGGIPNLATINQRRPMSPEMVELLRRCAAPGGTYIGSGGPDVSRIRALMDRGYATKPEQYGPWRATDAGHARLVELGK